MVGTDRSRGVRGTVERRRLHVGVLTDGAHARVFAIQHASQGLTVDANSHEIAGVKGAVDETLDAHAREIGPARRLRRLQAVLIHDVDDVVL